MKQHYFVVSFDETTKAWKWTMNLVNGAFPQGEEDE